MEQTAVEWLVENMSNKHSGAKIYFNSNKELVEQAKEMEKQQIIDFADNYVDNCVIPNENMAIPTIMDVPQYYKETFKSE